MHTRAPLRPCPSCACLHAAQDTSCPHCGAALDSSSTRLPAAAVLMGLALAGCGDKDGNTDAVALYGVADSSAYVDADGDGYTPTDGDCNDDDAAVHPDATETAGDGTDSNCDGADDT